MGLLHKGFKVNFPTEAGYPPKTTWYDMVMEYEQFDLIIEYFQGLTVEDNLIKVCPMLDQYENVSIYLGKDLDDPPYIGVPLEKATFLTIDQFSNLLSQKSELACFEIIKEAFFPTE